MPDDGKNLGEIEDKILTLSENYLAEGRPYYLSKLGLDLGEDLKKIKLAGKTLGEFLTERLSDKLTVVSTGEHNNIQAVVRSVGDTNLEFPSSDTDAVPLAKPPRYNPRFWAAFAAPVEGGRRFINIKDFSFNYYSDAPSEDFIEIEADKVPPADLPSRDAVILQNIAKWVEHHGLAADRFLQKNSTRSSGERSQLVGRSLLEAVIDSLEKRQLSTVSLPLDVVSVLMRTRI